MKKTLFLLVVVLVCNWSQSQIVNIPDPYFKAELLFINIDTNNDGEIQYSEAAVVTTLNMNNLQLISLVGIEAFTNLQNLKCTNSSGLTSVDISALTNLQFVEFSGCYNLTSLDFTGITNLQTLDCNYCSSLVTLDVSGLTNLQSIDCRNCSDLTSLNVLGLTNLQELDCYNCTSLVSLDVSGLSNLISLDCSDSGVTTITLTGASNLQTLRCNDTNLSALNLNTLSNLTYLDCYSNSITTLDVSQVQNLTHLNCHSNTISNLDVSSLINLTYLNCYTNTISVLNVEPLVNLTYLDCHWNLLTQLNVSNLTNLTTLECSDNQLSSLDVSTLTNLTHLGCQINQLTTLNVLPLTNLTYLSCHDNLFTQLDFSPLTNLTTLLFGNLGLNTVDVGMLVNLENLDFRGGNQESLNLTPLINLNSLWLYCTANSFDLSNLPSTFFTDGYFSIIYVTGLIESLNLKTGFPFLEILIQNCPNLNYICVNESDLGTLYLNVNAQVNSYCNFAPGGIYNTITGTVTMDVNNNGCETTDHNPTNFKIQLFDGTGTGACFTNNSGEYLFYTQAGNYQITPQLQNPYFNVTPATTQLTFPTVDGSNQILDVCITPNGIHNDIEITIIPVTPPAPGFDVDYRLTYTNKGNQTLSGSVNYTFDDAVLDFISATPTITSQSVNNLSWTYTNLLPFETRTIDIKLNLNGPTETPAVNINDNLYSNVSISPTAGDENEEDNFFSLNQIVVGSYDPNDKTCLEGNTITPSQVGDYLHYLIRFQNSGTAPAVNVVVKDMIDTTKFDMASLQLTSASHPHITRITNNKVEFIFENIQLPAEQDDEPGSHGFVAFKIKTKPNLVLGNTVSNTADIYFDYNFPIITNTTSTTVSNLGVNEFENLSVAMTPNPVKDLLTISSDDVITSVLIYDVQGRIIATQISNSTHTTLDMSQLNAGVYLVKVLTENGVKVEKILKN